MRIKDSVSMKRGLTKFGQTPGKHPNGKIRLTNTETPMGRNRLRLSLTLFLILLGAVIVSAIPAADEEVLGRQSEEAGKLREALGHYVTALKSTPEGSDAEHRLRERIIKLVQKIQPPPAVPEEAMRHIGRGQAAVEMAKRPEDYDRAIGEFKKAVSFAPWLSDGYYNLGVMQEKAGKFNEAINSFRLYLLAAPSSPDAQKVQTRIYALEYKAEQQREERRVKENKLRKEQQEKELIDGRLQSLNGEWWEDWGVHYNQQIWMKYRLRITGNNFELKHEGTQEGSKFWPIKSPRSFFRGTIKDLRIEGTHTDRVEGCWEVTFPLSGTVSPDLSRMTLRYKSKLGGHDPQGRCLDPGGDKEWTLTLKRR